MKLKTLLTAALLCTAALPLQADTMGDDSEAELIIYNRILAKVGDKTISVIDVMKKMDFFLEKHYPQFANSKTARHQFFASQWQDYLSQMIDTELIIADAAKVELKVSEADVREEILSRFGPNVMPNLDKLGLTYEETKQMIQDEITVQRMLWFRVNSKALNRVNSQDVKDAYAKYCVENPAMREWEYQVLSIRSPDKTVSEHLASKAFDLLSERLNLVAAAEQLSSPDEATNISLSQEIKADEKSISASHREVLETLADNSFSKPISQVSRADNSVVYRIFHLKRHSKRELPSFEKMADQLKEDLLQQAANKESAQYILKLRERFGFDEKSMRETLPDDFQPFALR